MSKWKIVKVDARNYGYGVSHSPVYEVYRLQDRNFLGLKWTSCELVDYHFTMKQAQEDVELRERAEKPRIIPEVVWESP